MPADEPDPVCWTTGSGLGLVTGDSGSGKTPIRRSVVADLRIGVCTVCVRLDEDRNVMDLYKSIAWELGLPTERNRAALCEQIRGEVSRPCAENPTQARAHRRRGASPACRFTRVPDKFAGRDIAALRLGAPRRRFETCAGACNDSFRRPSTVRGRNARHGSCRPTGIPARPPRARRQSHGHRLTRSF
jgi:hypothetical protein